MVVIKGRELSFVAIDLLVVALATMANGSRDTPQHRFGYRRPDCERVHRSRPGEVSRLWVSDSGWDRRPREPSAPVHAPRLVEQFSDTVHATTTTTTKTTTTKTKPIPRDLTKIPLAPPLLTSPRGTPFERAVWSLTYQIPPGCFSTYALLAAHLGSSPRAVGNALRRNPFAPEVPCHRVVATDQTLGGFKGKIARRDGEGITLAEKRTLLRKEGVRFDATGTRVLGTAFRGFL
ncbi:hypothetical protein VTJ49DRAFT_7618 [Mycothermus thermophilus]|uniref:Methylated-DNA--protein-cysteine methyltransferase n=1 Tax=Humicola insolens TaxID=85995 RepID=A0ABR3VGH2_HUMIN